MRVRVPFLFGKVVTGTVPALQPFEKTTVELACGNPFDAGVSYKFTVTIEPEGQRLVTLEGKTAPNP